MAGRSIIPEEGADIDLLEEVAYWLDHEFPEIDNAELSGMQCFKDDYIAMWYHPLDSQEITYLMGPVVKNFSCARGSCNCNHTGEALCCVRDKTGFRQKRAGRDREISLQIHIQGVGACQ